MRQMDPGTLMRLCLRPKRTLTSTLSSRCTPSRSTTSSTSLCRRSLDRRRLNATDAFIRHASSSAPRLQQQAALQEEPEDDAYPPSAPTRPSQTMPPPAGQQFGRSQSPQPAPSDPSTTPPQNPNVLDANQFYEQSTQPRRPKSALDFVPPSSRNPLPNSRSPPQARTTTQDTSRSSTDSEEETSRSPSGPNSSMDMMANVTENINRNAPTPILGQDVTQSVVSSLSVTRHNQALRASLRLKPSLGCTTPIEHSRGMDLQRAIVATERKVKLNKVRLEERQQRFHVRAGQKKKDLRSKRWRALFKQGFQYEVSRIQRMRRQGW